jgi:K+-transporting ATPase ATPase A chain
MRWLEYLAFLATVILLARPVGLYVARVFEGKPTPLDRLFRPAERALYRWIGVRPEQEMTPSAYLACFLALTAFGTALLFGLLMIQRWLPGGPDDRYLSTPMTLDLASNTALSFSTTTTWQAYGGETTLRYLVQIVGLAAQNFLAGAAGLAVGVAFIRGFARERSATLGNFWVDLVRSLLWVLLPASFVGSLVLVWQGVPLNADPYVVARTLEGREQVIARGPVAALEFIKNLGTNGGGFFNANGAHPYENPTPLTSFLAMLAIAVLPASFPITFGAMAGRPRAGWALLAVMVVLFFAGLVVCDIGEQSLPDPLAALGLAGGNLEGKEARFGVGGSVLAAVVTSNGATGSYSAMHESFRPLGILVPLVNMLLGEVTFGGLGTGLYSMVMIALVGIFMGGLMIGRTPEYLGNTIKVPEAKLIAWYTLLTPIVVSMLTAWAAVSGAGRADHQRRAARFHRDPVRLRLLHGQQRPDHGGPQRQQPVLQPDHCDCHGGGPVRAGRAGSGAGRPARRAGPHPGDHRLHAVRYADLRGPGAGVGGPGGRAVLPARAGPRAGRGVPASLSRRLRSGCRHCRGQAPFTSGWNRSPARPTRRARRRRPRAGRSEGRGWHRGRIGRRSAAR